MYKIESRRDCKTIPEKGSEIMAGIFMVGERKNGENECQQCTKYRKK